MIALVGLAAADAAPRTSRPDRPGHDSERGFGWRNDRPSIIFGEDVYVSLRARAVFDWRGFDPDLEEDTFDLNVARIGLKGEITRHFDFEIEREMDEDGVWQDWKDVYVNWDTFDLFQVRAGRYKIPFGLEQNLGRTEIDFVYRSRISTQLTPARDKGVTVSGRDRGLGYEIGLFDTDGDIGKLTEPQFTPDAEDDLGPTLAARVTATVFRPFVGEDVGRQVAAGGRGVHDRQPARRPQQPARRDAVRLRLLRAGLREGPPAAASAWSWTGRRDPSACARSGFSRARIDSARAWATATSRIFSARVGMSTARGS